jgi:NAD(P)H dehydrogenase (quinone)
VEAKKMNISIVFYSLYGHIYQMAKAIESGVKEVPDTNTKLLRVPDILSDEIIEKMGGCRV